MPEQRRSRSRAAAAATRPGGDPPAEQPSKTTTAAEGAGEGAAGAAAPAAGETAGTGAGEGAAAAPAEATQEPQTPPAPGDGGGEPAAAPLSPPAGVVVPGTGPSADPVTVAVMTTVHHEPAEYRTRLVHEDGTPVDPDDLFADDNPAGTLVRTKHRVLAERTAPNTSTRVSTLFLATNTMVPRDKADQLVVWMRSQQTEEAPSS